MSSARAQIERTDVVQLHPNKFGKNIYGTVMNQLKEKVEGTADKRYGYTILVLQITNKETLKGKLHSVTGFAHFRCRYLALVFKPHRNEVLLAVVKQVTEQGIWFQAGPLKVFITTANIPREYKYNDADKAYVAADERARIAEGTKCRIKLYNTNTKQVGEGLTAIGTIKGKYLGPMPE